MRIPSLMQWRQFVGDDERVPLPRQDGRGESIPRFRLKNLRNSNRRQRKSLFFDPSKLKCGIVTCGVCAQVDDVIRAIVLGLFYHYGVKTSSASVRIRRPILSLWACASGVNPETVKDIHKMGGSILSSSPRAAGYFRDGGDTLDRMNIGILFTIGGDGTLREPRPFR